MATEKKVQIRRCHVCGTVNENLAPEKGASKKTRSQTSQQCACCGKHLAPFYFFEESEHAGVGDNRLSMSLWKTQVGYGPLWGLSAIWADDP